MRTEDFKRGVVSILLVLGLVFSMILVAPFASPGDLIYDPGGENIEVAQGENFLIRHTLEWNEPEKGAYSVTIMWDSYDNEPSENFTFLGASAYFTTGPNAGESILAVPTLGSVPSPDYPGSTRYRLKVECPATQKDNRNGQFNVDITLGAYGAGGIPHIPGDHVIPWQFGGIIIVEKYPLSWPRDPITIRVLGRRVNVSISPSENSGLPGQTLGYTVTVTNTKGPDDIYDLTVKDNAGWGPTLSENLLEVPAGENRQTTLSVTIPAGALPSTKDKITVIATSRADNRVSAENICIARTAGVDVSISPSYLSGLPGENLEYTVTVMNFGVVADDYTLENTDTMGWPLSLENDFLQVPKDENRTTTLTVTIPVDATGGTEDTVTVTARLVENENVSDNASSIANVKIERDVEVSIEPNYQENLPGGTLIYTVTVVNTGNAPDNYMLENTDTMGWPLSLENDFLQVPKDENRTTTLTVTIPVDATGGTEDTVTVTATSTEDNLASDSDNCIAYVRPLRGVKVDISPVPSAPLIYTVTVTNIGIENDNYVLTVSDNANWGPRLSDNRLKNVQPNENRTLTLTLTIPENAVPSTEDNVIVTATSVENALVSDSASYIAEWPEETFYPIDDAEVRGETPDTNYGTSTYMEIGYEENAKRAFLKFKLENIPAGATIENVRLYLKTSTVVNNGENVQVHRVDNDDWDERTITWGNQPSVGKLLDNLNCSAGRQWYYWDVTKFVISQWENENDRVASFSMIGAGENRRQRHFTQFFSKEHTKDRWPYLRVFYRTSAHSFSVSISPPENSALPGRTLNYTVMVKNVGWKNSTYNLENRDDAGWNMALNNVQFENVPPGEGRTATLTVIIPDNASPGTRDNITVIGTLVENKRMKGYASCVAQSILPALEVLIKPKYQTGVPGWTLTYEVMVKNVGMENDNYSLKVNDKRWWRLTLDNNLFENVPPGENRTTTLRVTIPAGPPPSTEDEITVTATSMVDNRVENSASCIAHTGFAAVGVSITPENQSGLPGKNLEYIITIANMGNILDNYALMVSDNENWDITLSENLLKVPAGENRQTTLNVMVPADAPIYTRDNVTVTATSRADNTVENSTSCIAHSGFAAVEVLIAPENQSGEANYNVIPPFDLKYTVTVINKGTIMDTYILTVSNDNADWGLLLSDNTLKVPGGENGTVTLYVEIPLESAPLSTSGITVTATSQTDNTKSDSASCIAGVAIVDFEVSLSPSYQKGLLGKDLSYTLTVKNTGTGAMPKVHSWSISDNENWIPENVYENIPVSAGESKDRYLTVKVPDNASRGSKDNLTVQVEIYSTHTHTWITKKASAVAEATTLKNEVRILLPQPKLKRGKPGDNIAFPVVVRNLGFENDTYDLTVVDDALPSWNWRFDDNPLENVENGGSRSITLRVTIPDDAPPGMKDNLMLIATSRKDPTISDSDNCIVLVENFRGVDVSISPENKSGIPGETLTYEVKVKNKGNISDTYALTATDSAGWGPTLSKDSLELAPKASGTVTLTVTIPSGASLGAQDTITITAKSTQDPTVSDKASCIVSAVVGGVEVSISPSEDRAEPGQTLTFTITVRNTGSVSDNYILSVSDDAGWGATLAQNLLTIPAGGNRTTTVSVTVPSDAVENESTEITVVATSQAAPTVSDSASCRAIAKSLVKGIPLAVPLAISAFLIGAAIIVPTYLLRVRPRKAVRPTFFRERRRLGAISGMADLLRGRRKKAARRRVLELMG